MTALQERTRGEKIDEAEKALTEAEAKLGRESVELCTELDKLAQLYLLDGLYAKAEMLYKRIAEILSKQPDQQRAGEGLERLGSLYFIQGKLDDAESVYLRALAATEEGTREMAQRLCGLAGIYEHKRDYLQAEQLIIKAAQSYENALGGHNSSARLCYFALADLCRKQGKTGEADEYVTKSNQRPDEQEDTREASSQARALIQLGQLYYTQGRFHEVHSLLSQTVYCDDARLWTNHPRFGKAMHERGEMFQAQGLFSDAETAFKRALEIRLETLGQAHSEVAYSALSLATMLLGQNKDKEAEPYLKTALKTRVRAFGVEHPSVAACIETFASLLKRTKRGAIAGKLEARARDIRSKLVWQSQEAAAAAQSSRP